MGRVFFPRMGGGLGIRHLGFRGSGGGVKVPILWSGSSLPSPSSVAAAPPTEGGAATVPSRPWRRLQLTQVRRQKGLTSAESQSRAVGPWRSGVGGGVSRRRLARRSQEGDGCLGVLCLNFWSSGGAWPAASTLLGSGVVF